MPRAFRSLSSFATVALCVAGALLAPRAIAQDAPPSPSPQQQSLARLVGDWDLEATFFDNGKPIAKMQMQEHVESVCGGLFLLSRVDGDMAGKKLQGYTLKGWNAFLSRIEGVEVDSMGGPPARSVGNVDLETGVITWTLTVTTPQGSGSTESTLTFDGADKRTELIYAKGPNGEKVQQTLIRSTRRKAKEDAKADAAKAEPTPAASPEPASKEHEKLLPFVGTWDVKTKLSIPGMADAPTGTMKSNEQIVCLGRFVLTRVDGEFGGMPFHGVGLTGYDEQSELYVSFWGDSFGAYLMASEGKCSDDGTSFTLVGNSIGPDGKPNTTTDTTRFLGNDKRSASMVSRDKDGKEVSTMTLDCVRSK